MVGKTLKEAENEVQPQPKRLKTETSSSADVAVDYTVVLNADSDVKKAQELGLDADTNGFAIVYTDGACEANGRSFAKAGIGVYWARGHAWNVSEPVEGSKATNNTGEIQAVTRAIVQAREHGLTKLLVCTDSMFTINCVEKWMSGWKSNGWKTASRKDVKNVRDLKLLDEALQNTPSSVLHVRFKHVSAHCGIEGNEAADQLAVKGAKMYRNPDSM